MTGSRTRWSLPLQVPEFRAILAAHAVSLLGGAVAQVAIGVLVYSRTGSPLLTALVLAVGLMPSLLAGALLSAVAERHPARRVLVGCQLASAVVVALLAVPGLPTAAALALVFVLGALGAVFVGVRSAVLPDVLSAEVFPLGRALLRVVANVLQIGGYLVGGAALVVLSPAAALLLDALAFVVSALLLRRTGHRPPVDTGGVLGRSVAGLKEALRTPRLRRLLLLLWLPPAFAVVPEAVAVAYAAENGIGTAGLGLLLVGTLLGAVLGEVAVGHWFSGSARRNLVGPLLVVLVVPLFGFLLRPGVLVAVLLLVVSGAGLAYVLGVDPMLLSAAPLDLRSRLLGMATTLPMAAQGLAIAGAGALAEAFPPHIVIVVAGVAAAATALCCRVWAV